MNSSVYYFIRGNSLLTVKVILQGSIRTDRSPLTYSSEGRTSPLSSLPRNMFIGCLMMPALFFFCSFIWPAVVIFNMFTCLFSQTKVLLTIKGCCLINVWIWYATSSLKEIKVFLILFSFLFQKIIFRGWHLRDSVPLNAPLNSISSDFSNSE